MRVLAGVDLKIERGARVALAGPNGAGKSTLMRLLAGPGGARRRDAHARVPCARSPTSRRTRARASTRARRSMETVLAATPNDFVPHVRGLLGAFLFPGDEVEKRVAALSGGELNRLAIACLLVRPSNVLMLDEPTNHLDLTSKDALLESLRVYAGTIVFVSHDRHFLTQLADHVIEIGGGRAVEYPGGYESYLWRRAQDAAGAPAGSRGAVRVRSPWRRRRRGPRVPRRRRGRGRRAARNAAGRAWRRGRGAAISNARSTSSRSVAGASSRR